MFSGQRLRRQAKRIKKVPLSLFRGMKLLVRYQTLRRSGLFDADFYLRTNEDVRKSGLPPVWHYLLFGADEGRMPNALFDSNWYRRAYPDIARSNIDPVSHFLRQGAAEGRDPGPQFDLNSYLQENPEVRIKGVNALGHYLRTGRAEGRRIVPSRICRGLDASMLVPRSLGKSKIRMSCATRKKQPIDVIVPIYRDLEATRRCVNSVLASQNRIAYRLILIDDASPEVELSSYVASVRHPLVPMLVLRNKRNLGFVGTVNLGMKRSSVRDVVLLNSDAEVCDGWLDRLVAQAYSDKDVATVTPFSNNATICSYPRVGGESSLPFGLSLKQLDEAFSEANAGQSVDLPVGVGFCMLIRRMALQEVGFFDEAAFGRGYGEECDFCLKATKLGWRHLLACDTFVSHIGECSFKEDSRAGQARASQVIDQRYPTYRAMVARFVEADPMAEFRLATTLALLRRGIRPRVLQVCHRLGGGTEKHMQDVALKLAKTADVLQLRPGPVSDSGLIIDLDIPCGGVRHRALIRFQNAEQMQEFICSLGLESIHIHHILGVSKSILIALRRSGVPIHFTVHDYFTICPRIQLVGPGGVYCGEPDASGCSHCLAGDPKILVKDINVWRETNAWLIREVERVICPSEDVRRRLSRYFPGQTIDMVPHDDQKALTALAQKCHMPAKSTTLRVVVLGHLSVHKGKNFLLEMARLVVARGLPISFVCLGTWEQPPLCWPDSLRVVGAYKDDALSALIESEDPHMIFFPARWPETYSYTLSSALESRRMILAPRIGAFTERLAQIPSARLFSPWASPVEVLEILLAGPVTREQAAASSYA